MKKAILYITFIMLYLPPAYAYEIKVDTAIAVSDKFLVNQIIVTIHNTEEERIWLWLCDSKDNDSTEIKYHLMKRRPDADFSLFNIASDPNMWGCWWQNSAPLEYFIKCIEPLHSFTLVFYQETAIKERSETTKKAIEMNTEAAIEKILKVNENEMNAEAVLKEISKISENDKNTETAIEESFNGTENLIKMLKIYKNKDIMKYCVRGMTEYGIKLINYPYDVYIYPTRYKFCH